MNLCKRACLYSIRKKGKTLTLLAFLLVMATLMLTCLSIQSATETANANIKKALLGYFTINAKTLENGIPEDTVSQILDVDGLSGRYTLRSYTYATYFDADGNLLEINTEGAAQVPEGYENAGRVVANSNSQEDSYFTDGGFEMVEGNPITTETGSQVLIHEKFAQRNGLSVGDTMLLGNVENKDKTIPVTVAGIFTNTEEQDSIGMAPSYDLYDNIVFTDLSTASFLLYGTEGTTNVQYGDFYVNDPDELERIMTDVQELEGVDWENCTLTRYDNDYQNAKESLEGLQNIVFIAIAVVSVICFLVLALFLTLRLRGRIHETGVYLAMGISKGSVLLQYLLEVILVATIALVISFGTSTAISHQIGSSLLSQVTSETYETVDLTGESEAAEEEPTEDLGLAEIEVAVSAEDYALVWAFGMVLCVASTALAAYPIMKMKPKSIVNDGRDVATVYIDAYSVAQYVPAMWQVQNATIYWNSTHGLTTEQIYSALSDCIADTVGGELEYSGRSDVGNTYDSVLSMLQIGLLVTSLLLLFVSILGQINIGLSSLEQRAHELLIRRAIGASRSNIVLLVLGSQLILSAFVCVVSILISILLVQGIGMYLPADSPVPSPDYPILVAIIAVVASVATALLGGLLPALKAAKLEPALALR